MNIHRYVIPATVAAAFHAALVWLIPPGTAPDLIKVIEVPLRPWPKNDDPVEPPEPRERSTEPVTPLAGSPVLPSIDPPPALPTKTDFPMPLTEPATGPFKPLLKIPEGGPGIGGPGTGPGTPGGDTIWTLSNLDRAPAAKSQMPPEYPSSMRHTGTGGSVLVEFDVNTEGRVTRAEALKYSNPEFVEPALRAVRRWRFEPGRRGGALVPFRVTVPIEFGIENG